MNANTRKYWDLQSNAIQGSDINGNTLMPVVYPGHADSGRHTNEIYFCLEMDDPGSIHDRIHIKTKI